jgi:hypothetical protein
MASEPLHIFDPPRNFQLRGFPGRAAATTIHDATFHRVRNFRAPANLEFIRYRIT